MNQERKINKADTTGMSLKTATGKTFTREMYEEFTKLKEEGKVKSTFVYKKKIYYQYQDSVIKYDTDNHLAFYLDKQKNRWMYSNLFTIALLTDINAFERLYSFSDVDAYFLPFNIHEVNSLNKVNRYQAEQMGTVDLSKRNNDGSSEYYLVEDGRIFRRESASASFFQLDFEHKIWKSNQNFMSLYYDSFLKFQEIRDFQDCFDSEKLY